MPFKPHTSIVRSYSERHKPPVSAAPLGNCLGEVRAHTHPWNRNTRNPCHLPVNVLYCRCHAPDVTKLPSVLQPSHSSFLKRSLRHVIAHYATQDSKNVIITNNNKTIACMCSAPSGGGPAACQAPVSHPGNTGRREVGQANRYAKV